MVFPKARLAVSACLFLAWIGFLAFLVARTRNPVILSRPQLDVADLVVLADVGEKDGRPLATVKIKTALTNREQDTKLAGTVLTVVGLVDCDAQHGWTGPGEYIIPLTKHEPAGPFEVTPLPFSPGYRPAFVTIELLQTGPEKEKVRELVSKYAGLHQKGEVAAGILRRNVSRPEAEDIEKQLKASKASVRLSESESRIYRATPDALEQLKKGGEKGQQ